MPINELRHHDPSLGMTAVRRIAEDRISSIVAGKNRPVGKMTGNKPVAHWERNAPCVIRDPTRPSAEDSPRKKLCRPLEFRRTTACLCAVFDLSRPFQRMDGRPVLYFLVEAIKLKSESPALSTKIFSPIYIAPAHQPLFRLHGDKDGTGHGKAKRQVRRRQGLRLENRLQERHVNDR